MVSCNCIIINVRKLIPWIGILFTFSLLSAFSGYGFFFSITTITSFFIFTFSTIFLTFLKQKTVVLLEEPKQEQQEEEDHRQEYPAPVCLMITTTTTTTEQPKIESFSSEKKNIRSRDLLYSESHDQLSSSDCQDSDDMDLVDDDRNPTECSDDDDSDSISDEESLIEIALPSGTYVGCPKNLDQDHHHHQASFMERLAEINDMNEEENLIEIDLSMGSIKCSRFEIQA